MALKFMGDRGNMYIYPWYISDLTATKDIAVIAGTKVAKAFMFIEKDFLRFYYDDKSTTEVARSFVNNIKKDKNFFKKVIKNIYKYGDELLAFCEDIDRQRSFKGLTDGELIDILRDYIKRLTALRIWGWVPAIMEVVEGKSLTNYLMKKFKDYLEKIGQINKLAEYYSILSSSEKKSGVFTEELARLNLLLKILKLKNARQIIKHIRANNYEIFTTKYPVVDKLFKQHLKKFGWLTYAYSGPLMGIEHLLKLLQENIKQGDILGQKKKLLDHYKNIVKEKALLINKLHLPEELVYLFKVSAELMYIKDYRKSIYQQSYAAMDRVIMEIARRLGLSLKGAKYLVLEEIIDALKNKKFDFYKKVVSERMQKCCYIAQNGKISIYQGKKCDEIINKEIKPQTASVLVEVTEVKGMIAYRGKVQGEVRIVLAAKDVEKVREGDILVSSSTNPDLLLAMKKAGAIVTDFGGIVSHAAIVSRELKKPCVVGTKQATHIFKDGDLVEVDADNGIVKMIKKG